MAKTKTPKAALPYMRQLIEDQYVQEQLREAVGGLRAAYERARKERARATEDKRLYGHVRDAATSIRKAAVALQKPKPKPKRRLRKVAILTFAVGGTALLTLKLQKQSSGAETSPPGATSSPTGAASSAPGADSSAPGAESSPPGADSSSPVADSSPPVA